jgi:hypothetical protein
MTLAKVKAKANKTFKVQASLTVITYDCQNIFIVQATACPTTVVNLTGVDTTLFLLLSIDQLVFS